MNISNIVNVVGTFISYLNVALIYCKISKTKFRPTWYFFVLLFLMSVFNAYAIPLLPLTVKPIYNFICLCLSILLLVKVNFKTVLYYVSVIWIVGIMLDIVFMAFFSILFKRMLQTMPTVGLSLISIVLQVLLNLIFRIRKINDNTIKLKQKIDSVKNNIWLFISIIALVVYFAVTSFTNVNATKNVLMLLLLLFIVVLLFVFLIKILYEEKTFKLAIENLINNNKYYWEVNTQNRIFKHNIIHRLNSIKSVGDLKVNKLVDDLIDDYNLNTLPSKGIDVLPNGINGIISRIIYNENKTKINLAIDNYLNSDLLSVLTPRKYNKLCETIGICLDNAINATEKSKEKILQIVMIENDKKIIIKIINTFDSSLEVDKVGTVNYSTKKGGHGLGLYSLFGRKDVVLKSSIINNLFENDIIIEKNKNLK